MGFGRSLDDTPMLLTPGGLEFTWEGTLHMLAEGLGLTLDGVEAAYEKRPAEKQLRIGEYTIESAPWRRCVSRCAESSRGARR